ncbi:MAG: NAD(P)-dependent oxidoreductase [Actinomadura rubrobrunea]|nr:NAD(P)-dependent oxidoreductase [Actinomadura rubrobrunea]
MLDHRAVREILDAAGDALAGRVVVNLTSGTPEEARQVAARAAERGVRYLDGAIMAVPTMIGSERALVFYGGPEEVYRAHEPTPAAIAGAGTHLGDDVGRPSLFDLALLGLMSTTWAGFIHALALVTGEKANAADFLPFARAWFDHVIGPEVPRIADQVDRRRCPGEGSALGMQTVAIDHLVEASRALKVDAELPEYLRARARQAIDRGHADDGFGSLFEVLSAPAD